MIYLVNTGKMYNLRKLIHNSFGQIQNLPESRQITWRTKTAHGTKIIANLFHEFFNSHRI